MSSAAVADVPVARSYTRARRHPWVLGKLGEIRLWLGPYTRPQFAVAGVGMLLLGKTISWWWPVFGPLPVIGLGFAVWAVRHARIGGRVPEAALWGWVLLLVQPRSGRIGGRPAKDPAPAWLDGGFFVSDTTAASPSLRTKDPSHPAAQGLSPTGRARAQQARIQRPPRPRLQHRPPARAAAPSGPRTTPASRPALAAATPRSGLDLLLERAGARNIHTDKEQ